MLANFFVLTCPYLYDVGAIAYFGLTRDVHAPEAVSQIMGTTQVFLDIHRHKGQLYVHPIKVQQRHSPTMYMLHAWQDDGFFPVSESAVTAEILSTTSSLSMQFNRPGQGIWHDTLHRAEETFGGSRRGDSCKEVEAADVLRELLHTAVTRDPQMAELLQQHLTIKDVLEIGRRIIGTGLIGGKAVGMLLARAILKQADPGWNDTLEVHDSFYVGSDVFHAFLVQNGLWWERQKHWDSVRLERQDRPGGRRPAARIRTWHAGRQPHRRRLSAGGGSERPPAATDGQP